MRTQLEEAELQEGDDGFASGEELPTWEDWREYLGLIRWLVPDVYRHARLRTIALAALSSIGVSTRAATIGTLLLYVHAQRDGREIVWHNIHLPSDTGLLTFLLWGGAALVFAILTVTTSYSADRLAFDLSRSYMEDSTRRVLRYVAAGGELRMPEMADDPGGRPVMRLLVGHTFRLVRVVLQSLSILLPAITLLAAVGVLIATNAVLTAVLLPIICVYGLLLSHLNRNVMRDSQRREIARRVHTKDVTKMVRTLNTTRYAPGAEPLWLQGYPERSWMGLTMQSFRGIVLAKRRVDYLGDLFQGTALMLVLVVFGTMIASQGAPWTVLLTYLVALGYATKAMGRCSKCVTTANRFIPQVRQYFAFIDSHPDIDSYVERVSRGFPDGLPVFRCGSPALPESRESLAAAPGEPILCGYPRQLINIRLGEFCFALANGDAGMAVVIDAESFFQTELTILPERELWELLPPGEDRTDTWRRAVRLFDAMGVLEEFRENLGGPDGMLTADLDRSLSPALRFALRLMPGLVSTQKLVILGVGNLEALSAEQQRAVFDAFSDRVVLVVTSHPVKQLPESIRHTLFVGEESVLGIGDREWFTRIANPHLEILSEDSDEVVQTNEPGRVAVDDDDEEEDDD